MPFFEDRVDEAAAQFLAKPEWEEEIFDLKRDELWFLAEFLKLELPTEIRKGQLLREVLRVAKSDKGTSKEAVVFGETDRGHDISKGEAEEIDELGNNDVSELRLNILSQQARIKELEYKALQLKAEERGKEREHEIRLQMMISNNSNSNSNRFDLMHALKLVPVFNEEDVPDFFISFERIAKKLNWPKDMWTTMLQCKLKGKAQRVYNTLSEDLASDYDTVKSIILRAYDLIPEAYRQKFRNFKKETGMTFVEFARKKEQFLDDWMKSKEADSFDKLKELIVVEEFKRMVGRDLKIHLDELKLDSLQEIAIASDEYSLAHRQDCVKENNSKRFLPRNNGWRGNNRNQSDLNTYVDNSAFDRKRSKDETESRNGSNETRSFVNSNRRDSGSNKKTARTDVICHWCNRRGHLKVDCFARRNFLEKNREPVALVSAEVPRKDESK